MTRSIRRTQIVGVTKAESDKSYKEMEHRRERRAVKVALRADEPLPDRRAFGDPWGGDKDGKQFLANQSPATFGSEWAIRLARLSGEADLSHGGGRGTP